MVRHPFIIAAIECLTPAYLSKSLSWPGWTLAVFGLIAGQASPANGQIIPDNSLRNERSRVTSTERVDFIDQGARRRNNLFHSFSEFNVDQDRGAYFVAPPGVDNIFSRITGNSPSFILGILGVVDEQANFDDANLFFMNPNGIIFGPQSALAVQGSFLATTADTVQFKDQGFFSTLRPNTPELLTINPSAFLFSQTSPSPIVVNSITSPTFIFPDPALPGLQVGNGQNLVLIGGDIDIRNSGLYALDGRIELASVASEAMIQVSPNFRLNLHPEVSRGRISINSSSIIARSGIVQIQAGDARLHNSSITAFSQDSTNAGDIQIETDSLALRNGSLLSTSTTDDGNAGTVVIKAETLSLGRSGDNPRNSNTISSNALPNSAGNAGAVFIMANTLDIQGGAAITVDTLGVGNAGRIVIETRTLSLLGTSKNGRLPSGLFSDTTSPTISNAGRIQVNTNTLNIRDGARISTITFGAGDAGDIRIQAEIVSLSGSRDNGLSPSGIVSAASPDSSGEAGTIRVTTNQLDVRNGAAISTDTFGAGNAGNLVIEADTVSIIGISEDGQRTSELVSRSVTSLEGNAGTIQIEANILEIRDGASVSTSTSGGGTAGDILIEAETVLIDGFSVNERYQSNLFSTAEAGATGNAGTIQIDAEEVSVADASIRTSAEETSGGQITIDAASLRLSGDGDIQTEVFSGAGGAGDIRLTADSILAFDDSDILAFADDGRGGNIRLNTPAFFGENFNLLSLNADPSTLEGNERVDVNATGAVSGTVVLPDLSFIQNSLAELPQDTIDTDALLASSCVARSASGSTFLVTGSGGLPERPGEVLPSQYPTDTIRSVTSEDRSERQRSWGIGDPVEEPQGLYQLPDGRLILSQECSFE